MRIIKAKDYADMSRKAANIIAAQVPVSILQMHPNVIVVVDDEAAGSLI